MERIAQKGAAVRTVTLMLKFSDFSQITRARSLPVPLHAREAIENTARELLRAELPLPRSVRLLGVTLSSLEGEVLEAPATGLLEPVGVTRL